VRQWGLQLAAWLLAFAALEPSAAGELKMRWSVEPADRSRAVVVVSGLDAEAAANLERTVTTPAQWQSVLAVRAEKPGGEIDPALPAMAGSYRVEKGGFRFTPLFPLAPGVGYLAVLDPSRIPGQTGELIKVRHRISPGERGAGTVVSQIYPSAAVLPENLLKFYVHFSAAMSRGHIYEHIHLVDAAGKTVELPFLELDEELWNPAMTRLTLFIDPGRIKRGVRPLEEIGPALVAGERFRLVVDGACRDADGQPLAAAFEKAFVAGPPEREPIEPKKWVIKAPAAGTRGSLCVDFERSLDHAITQRVLRIADEAGKILAGTSELEKEERTWKFTPTNTWVKGRYEMIVPTAIEDLAGNNVGKPFDVDLVEGTTESSATAGASVRVPFSIQ